MNVPQWHDVEGWAIQEGRGAAFRSPCIPKRNHFPGLRIPPWPGPIRWPRSLPPGAGLPCGKACSCPPCTGHGGATPFPSWSSIPARSTGRKRRHARFALGQASRMTPLISFTFTYHASILNRADALTKIHPSFQCPPPSPRNGPGEKNTQNENLSTISLGKAIDINKPRPEQSKG